MKKFTSFSSRAIPMPIENVDTDQIIPARFLKMVTKTGFGENLFYDWRYQADGAPKQDFILNNPHYKGEILVCGNNFGCGSSREHAAWALVQYGFQVVISSEFADIFKNNALNNGLLPIIVNAETLDKIFTAIEKNAEVELGVDLINQKLAIPSEGLQVDFEVDQFKKKCLIQGMDELDYLLSLENDISEFEDKQLIY